MSNGRLKELEGAFWCPAKYVRNPQYVEGQTLDKPIRFHEPGLCANDCDLFNECSLKILQEELTR